MRTLFTNQSAYKKLLLWLIGEAIVGIFFYALVSHLPDFAQVIILLVAIVVIWRDPILPKRATKSYATLLFWLPVALGLFCSVIWKITGEDVWVRLGIVCICVRAVYRGFDWATGGWPTECECAILDEGQERDQP